jgi:hypothetical protein
LVDFIYKNDLFLKEKKKFVLIEKADSHLGDSIRLRKKVIKAYIDAKN